jgi:hypothetical protein
VSENADEWVTLPETSPEEPEVPQFDPDESLIDWVQRGEPDDPDVERR